MRGLRNLFGRVATSTRGATALLALLMVGLPPLGPAAWGQDVADSPSDSAGDMLQLEEDYLEQGMPDQLLLTPPGGGGPNGAASSGVAARCANRCNSPALP